MLFDNQLGEKNTYIKLMKDNIFKANQLRQMRDQENLLCIYLFYVHLYYNLDRR